MINYGALKNPLPFKISAIGNWDSSDGKSDGKHHFVASCQFKNNILKSLKNAISHNVTF